MLRLCMLLVGVIPSISWAQAKPWTFKDVGIERGVLPHVAGIRGHGAAWGDIDGTGFPALFVTTFHNAGSKPSMLFRNARGQFTLDPQEVVRTSGIGSGSLFVDLTNSGKLDLYISNCAHGKDGVTFVPSFLLRNDGTGKFTDVSKDSGACPTGFQGRGLAALDYDGDGLLDLLICEQYYSPKVTTGLALYRNRGNHQFVLANESAGLPVGLGGLGVAVGDVNNDTWPDLFVSCGTGEHRLFLNNGRGKFREVEALRAVIRWDNLGREDFAAGACLADVNNDGLLDIVVGHHGKAPWTAPMAIRMYLNRGVKDGVPEFVDCTSTVGLTPLAMKAPHIEVHDFDNDGQPDIFTSIVKFQDGQPCPIIFRNQGSNAGLPSFSNDAWSVNDFPTAEDKALRQSGKFFEKALKEKKIIYMAAAPCADFDRDGKMDLFLANWWLESPSLLLKNETVGGQWLDVVIVGKKVNRMGIGTRINAYRSGMFGQPKGLLGSREIAIGYGFCSGQEARAHFGLGQETKVDLEIVYPHGRGRTVLRDATVGRTHTINAE